MNVLEGMNYLNGMDNLEILHKIAKRLRPSWLTGWQCEADHVLHAKLRKVSVKEPASCVSLRTRQQTNFACDWNRTHKTKEIIKSNSDCKVYNFAMQTNHVAPNKSKKCTFCNNPHFLIQCKQFCKLAYMDRIKFVNDHKFCWCCVDSWHFAKVCARNSLCKKPHCTQRHTTLLHPPDSIVLPSAEEGSKLSSDVTDKFGFAGVNNKPSNNVLPIVPV